MANLLIFWLQELFGPAQQLYVNNNATRRNRVVRRGYEERSYSRLDVLGIEQPLDLGIFAGFLLLAHATRLQLITAACWLLQAVTILRLLGTKQHAGR